MSALFDPDQFVDRVAEQALFHRVLSFEDDARVLTIQDGRGRGKSHLLRLLRHQCKFGNPPVAVCYVALDELAPCDPYSFTVAAARALSEFDGIELPGLREAEEQRFERRMGALAHLHGQSQIGTAGDGTTAAGISVGGDLVINGAAADSDPALQERLRYEATRAFRRDLRELSAAREVVLLVDAFEASTQALADWLHELLRECLGADDKLVLVLAGQRIPTATLRQMLDARFTDVVRSVNELSSWEPDHVRAVLDAQGVQRYDDADVAYLVTKLAAGLPIGLTVATIVQFLREDGS